MFLGVSIAIVAVPVVADVDVPASRLLLEGGATCVDIVWLRWWSFEGIEGVFELEWP